MASDRSGSSLKRLAIILIVGAGLCSLAYFGQDRIIAYFVRDPNPPKYARLRTGGTSVMAFLLENRWKAAYQKAKQIDVVYDSTGSTQGVDRMIDQQYAIGFTHARISDKQRQAALARGGEVIHVPIVICAVVPIYNVKQLKDKPPLRFTGEVLADIFQGKIKRWNDPALKQLNEIATQNPKEKVVLPDTEITVVHRSDSSGTTFIFTDFLTGASPSWAKAMGPARSKLDWPVGKGVERNHGVAEMVYNTEGAIGYTDLLYTSFGNLQYGAVQNKDRSDFIHVTAKNMTAAVHGMLADIPDDLTFPLTNVRGHAAYPICGAVWAVCYRNQPAANYQHVVDFLQWITHDGQQFAADMSYAPLPDELVRRAEEKIKSIQRTP
jgi:phosphate transport system substrate-binding protein